MSSYSQRQQTAYLFKTAVIDSLDSGEFVPNGVTGDWEHYWAGRPPLFFESDAQVDDKTKKVFSYNVHAKAFGDESSYNRRKAAAESLKEYLDNYRNDDNVLFLGDFNDQLNFSTYNEEISPYISFIDDDHYFAVTKPLEDRGFASYLSGQFRIMIDHIIVTNELVEDHIDDAQRVENPHYIPSYISTTSDHAPVWTRFRFTGKPDEPGEIPDEFIVEPNYPNPFHPVTNIRFAHPEQSTVTIYVYDVLGNRVTSIARDEVFSEGQHIIPFDASSLSSGLYIYRIILGSGQTSTHKMMHVK